MPETDETSLDTELLSNDALLDFIDELIMFAQWEDVYEAKYHASLRGLLV